MNIQTLTCPACDSQVPTSALLCPHCGRPNISTAFAGTYSPLESPVEAQPHLSGAGPGEPYRAAGPAQVAQAPSRAQGPTPSAYVPERPTTTGLEQRGADALGAEAATRAIDSLPGSRQPGGPGTPTQEMTLKELDEALAAAPRPIPRPHTLMAGGELPRPAGLPGGPRPLPPAWGKAQPQRMSSQPAYDLKQASQSQTGYVPWAPVPYGRPPARGGQRPGAPVTTRTTDLERFVAAGLFLLVGLVLWVVAISLGAANGVFLLILIWITLGLWVALSKSS